MVTQSLYLWEKRRSRADNISAVVAFFDDEFENTTFIEEEEVADTDICSSNEEDTPPMINVDSDASLVRQLAFEKVNSAAGRSDGLSLGLLSQGKRKNEDTVFNDDGRKVKNARVNSTEDINECSIVTVLSSESLYGLQLDEDLGFADDESDDATTDKHRKSILRSQFQNTILENVPIQSAK